MVALSVVNPSTTPCPCSKCQHMGTRIHREYLKSIYAADELTETKIAELWHAYRPYFDRTYERMPIRVRHQTFTAKETTALRELRDFNDRTGRFVADDFDEWEPNIAVLSGPTGTGKTVAAVWLAMHRLAREEPIFITAAQLARFPRYGDEREDLLSSSALIIDDLGTERTDEKFNADFDELVDRVYQGYQILVITTNCTAPQFRKRYGARVVDRLAERGVWIPCVGSSMRGRP